MSFKRAKVVMLPTNEKAQILKFGNFISTNSNNWYKITEGEGQPQHLYVLSDEKIKKGDWIPGYDENSNQITGFIQYDGKMQLMSGVLQVKVIASTDKSLKTSVFSHWSQDLMKTSVYKEIYLPEPSPQFIEKYIASYNTSTPITDVLIEYEQMDSGGINSGLEPVRLKINSKDNTITIKKAKDSWTKDEILALLKKAGEEYHVESLRNGYFAEKNL